MRDEQKPVVVLTADTLMRLVERVVKLEQAVKDLREVESKDFNDLLQMLGEYVPLVTERGLRFRTIRQDSDEEEFEEVPLLSRVPTGVYQVEDRAK